MHKASCALFGLRADSFPASVSVCLFSFRFERSKHRAIGVIDRAVDIIASSERGWCCGLWWRCCIHCGPGRCGLLSRSDRARRHECGANFFVVWRLRSARGSSSTCSSGGSSSYEWIRRIRIRGPCGCDGPRCCCGDWRLRRLRRLRRLWSRSNHRRIWRTSSSSRASQTPHARQAEEQQQALRQRNMRTRSADAFCPSPFWIHFHVNTAQLFQSTCILASYKLHAGVLMSPYACMHMHAAHAQRSTQAAWVARGPRISGLKLFSCCICVQNRW